MQGLAVAQGKCGLWGALIKHCIVEPPSQGVTRGSRVWKEAPHSSQGAVPDEGRMDSMVSSFQTFLTFQENYIPHQPPSTPQKHKSFRKRLLP